jgi:TatD DNase family protein
MSNNDTFYTVDFGVNFANKSRYPDVELEKLMEESYNSGVDRVVCISNSIPESKINLELEKKYPNLYFTLGIHPHNAKQFKKSDIAFLETNISNPKCYGIGECGLDYNRMFSPKEKQLEVFGIQIDLASKYNLPLYLHCRDAMDDFIELLKEKNYFNGLVHCFTGNLNQALELVGLGFKLGITGWIFDSRRNKDLVNVVKSKKIPLNMLVVETDAPFMPIRPAKISIPSDTGYIVEEIARLRQIDIIDCGKQIYSNSIQMLNKIV